MNLYNLPSMPGALRRYGGGLCTCALLAACGTAAATVPRTHTAGDTGWRLQVTPYVWTLGLKSSLTLSPALPTVQVAQSFSNVLSGLKAAAFVNATARRGPYVLQADASYASLAHHTVLPPGLPVRAKLQQSSLTLTGGSQWQLHAQHHLDVMAGLRAWHLHTQVQAEPLLDARLSRSFVDPIVAVRWRYAINDAWSTLLYADAGGWNVGSKRTWQWLATVNYQWSEQLYFSAGYRRLYVDYRDGAQRMQAHLAGPVVGATWLF